MQDRLKVLVVFGTRPEAIKMAPVVNALQAFSGSIETRVCVTAQHRQMLDSVMDVFDLEADYDLDVMRPNQALGDLTANVVRALSPVLAGWRPDRVLVHGDTTTTMAASLAAFYAKIPVAHVEAGLRTGDRYAPWPEEMNRALTARLADLHYAPTAAAKANLLREGISERDVVVTGNTVIDALFMTRDRLAEDRLLASSLDAILGLTAHTPLVLMTGHRRENFGENFDAICRALRRILVEQPRVTLVWPLHLNPSVREPVRRILGDGSEFAGRLRLLDPLDYLAFTRLLTRATLILTDSGGIQEEAAALGKPTLVLREATERPEVLEAGTAALVGADELMISSMAGALLRDEAAYERMSRPSTVFGDGRAALRIVRDLAERHAANTKVEYRTKSDRLTAAAR